jgi:hypothetical protein
MKRSLITIVFLCVFFLAAGCTQKRGTIYLDTRPQGATVYLDNLKQGETPLSFQWDAKIPAKLTIEKDGYYSEVEQLNKAWLVRENRKGEYQKSYETTKVEGKEETSARVWKVKTFRDLKEKRE